LTVDSNVLVDITSRKMSDTRDEYKFNKI